MSDTINKSRKTRTGSVVSNRMEKSVVVKVERKVRHKLYGKFVKTCVKYLADDPENQCNIGDTVLIEECRPLSKRKRWRVKSIVEQAV
ncbi:MAG: 30S ribosomal protein S17 [Desulforhopalus sp.]|jgi:small subunit ribosomal protein S17|uniref:30S ribosomal protein S17 n=1 Tax=Desulforhopalus vacuolatus TaxID=40414 RepID=UPI00196606B7|nr:30S ribosomal protein S17 [Desulforhopalus vacuolatus]MBM9518837.1 30S ribosomal protein S17 [Desulforhopalus vacuolatus]MCK9174206.1 30S ribosomal protein S17 [Desulforhopalus sp.]